MVDIVTRSSWKLLPLPEHPTPLAVSLTFNQQQTEKLRRGLTPLQMEDRWFVFVEDDWLYVCRSWTGEMMFGVQLRETPNGSCVTTAWVNAGNTPFSGRDDESYRTILTDALSAVFEQD